MTNQFGPYRVEAQIGRGGMGTVYAATDERDGTAAAIKVLSATLAGERGFRERFATEIETLKRLSHPQIVRLFGYGEQDGHLFYVMERVDGMSLQEELRRGRRFTWREVVSIAVQVCSALKHAHDHGIIHRDLKPSNLVVDQDNHVKLFDFGIAKLFGVNDLTLGGVVGTADYMAPEQASGEAVGPRSDLYSLGAVMYALLAGRPPFTGRSVAELVHKVRNDPPLPVSRFAGDVPAEMERVIDSLLEKDPRRRPPTALALSHQLQAMEHALSIPQNTSRRQPVEATADDGTPSGSSTDDPLTADPYQGPTVLLPERHTPAPQAGHAAQNESLAVSASSDHFTEVSATEDHSRASSAWASWWSWGLSLLVIAAASVAVISGIWYASQDPSAQKLYDQIVRLADDDVRPTARLQPLVDTFLQHYPEDPRAPRVREIHEDLQLEHLRRHLARQVRQATRNASLRPIEHAYLDSLQLSESDPDEALEILQALIAVYDAQSDGDPHVARCVKLAREQHDQLMNQVASLAQKHLPVLKERLDCARSLEGTEPESALAIYRGILRLYGDKSWANQVVQQARDGLARLTVSTAFATPAEATGVPDTSISTSGETK